MDSSVARRLGLLLVAILLGGAALRAVDVWRPADRPDWREADISAVARNYVHEGMNPIYPRVDWRGSTPGFAEMEFPILPWGMASLYQIFGQHEGLGRVLSYLFGLASLGVITLIARQWLGVAGTLAAVSFFALSPLPIRLSSALQSDGLMLLGVLVGVYAFTRWVDSGSRTSCVAASAGTAIAILAKATAAHIGLFYLLFLWDSRRLAWLKDRRVWFFGFVCLAPAALWYWHAHNFYRTYGLSLGVSNESHWAGLSLFGDPKILFGIWGIEVLSVFTVSGLVFSLVALMYRRDSKPVRYALYWLAATWIYYLLIGRTASKSWAVYYHVVSVPPAALLIGAGVDVALEHLRNGTSKLLYALIFLAVVLVPVVFLSGVVDVLPIGATADYKLLYALFGLWGIALTVSVRQPSMKVRPDALEHGAIIRPAFCVSLGLALTLPAMGPYLRSREPFPLYACAVQFKTNMSEPGPILVSGGDCRDSSGKSIAFNSSYMFYWLDRKGWNICTEEQSVVNVTKFASAGARYFVAEKRYVEQAGDFEQRLRQTYPVRSECSDALLLELTGSG